MAPTQTFDTPAKMTTIRDCIVLPHPTTYTATPLGDGWRVWIPGANMSAFAVDLQPIPIGTHVEVRMVKAPLHIAWDEDVAPCLDNLPKA